MSYILGQYAYSGEEDNTTFSEYISIGEAKRFKQPTDIYRNNQQLIFFDECIYINDSEKFNAENNYYFHGKIQKKSRTQTFLVKLMQVELIPNENENVRQIPDSKEQYLKTITINGGENSLDFVDIEFMFSPLENFNCIVFELQRSSDDYVVRTRYAKIIYEELSLIKNIISVSKNDKGMGLVSGTTFLKIGVQGRPGMLMCINNEEIRNSRTGIFEIKNGILIISFFSIINAAKESSSAIDDYITSVINAENASELDVDDPNIWSECFFSTDKKRTLDSFTFDYIYEQRRTQG